MENKIEYNSCWFQSPKPVPHILLWLRRVERKAGVGGGNVILSFCKVLSSAVQKYIQTPTFVQKISNSFIQ